ncbi:MAG: alanine racemase [Thermoleophilaceae bacterium]|nr:alanine racemase [Thermoleophilaceae bacterium]
MPERALARVSDGAVERNCSLLRSSLTGGAQLCAVVKAAGYGHGAVEVARAALKGGASWLAVATAAEAAELRAEGIDARLFVMGALTFADLEVALAADADVGVWSAELLDAAAARGPARVHVKLDTGMGRLGAKDPDEVRALCERAAADDRLELAGIWTHFATADEPGDAHFPDQLRHFAPLAGEIRASYPGTIAHAANSAATLRDPAAHFDLVRCGVGIYGLDPFQRDPADHGLEPALSLYSYVAAVKRFEPGESAGYGRRWHATEPTWLGVLPIGYGDGWRRGLTNNADVLVGGRRHPLVGTVSMDNITIDLGPETDVQIGDEAVLIGAQGDERILAEEVAERLSTINYEITCGIGRRVRYLHEQ